MVIQSELIWACSSVRVLLSEAEINFEALRHVSEHGMAVAEKAKKFSEKFVGELYNSNCRDYVLMQNGVFLSGLFEGMMGVFENAYMLSLSGINDTTKHFVSQICVSVQTLLDASVQYNADWVDPHACELPLLDLVVFGNDPEISKCDGNPSCCWGIYDEIDSVLIAMLYGTEIKRVTPADLHKHFNVPEWEVWANIHYTTEEETLRDFSYKKACETMLDYARAIVTAPEVLEIAELDRNISEFGNFDFVAYGMLVNNKHGKVMPGVLADNGQQLRLRVEFTTI